MKREILISSTSREIRVAIIEDDQVVEMLVDRPEARRMVGGIYLGKVEAVQPGIQAAFVDPRAGNGIGGRGVSQAFALADPLRNPPGETRTGAEQLSLIHISEPTRPH